MVKHGSGIHDSDNINQLGKPVPLEQRPKDWTAKAGARWKRPPEWPKAKADSLGRTKFRPRRALEGPRVGLEMTMWPVWLLVVVPYATWNAPLALCGEGRVGEKSPFVSASSVSHPQQLSFRVCCW